MKTNRTTLILPILLIAFGAGWLLTTLKVAPEINWVWTLGLAVFGLLTFVIGGFDKVSLFVGPLLFLACVLSILRQTGLLGQYVEVPILLIASGVLMLIARSPAVPMPRWYDQEREDH